MKQNIEFDGYRTLRHLGSGGAGDVYLAQKNDTSEKVAIKLLRSDSSLSSDSKENLNRFSDEVAAALKVRSKYVVKALDWGQTKDGCPFIIYEYLQGGNLQEHLSKVKTYPWEKIYDSIVKPLLAGLDTLHRAGVIHRDIKPENLFLCKDGFYKIGDCGLASFSERSARTKTGMIVGTPLYMAPERLNSERLVPTKQMDIYSAGLVIIKAISGNLPTIDEQKSSSKIQFIRQISRDDVLRCNVPESLIDVLFKSVQKDVELRFESAATFLKVIPQILPESEEQEPPSHSRKPGTKKEVPSPTSTIVSIGSKKRSSYRRNVLLVLMFILVSLTVYLLSARDQTVVKFSLNRLSEHSSESPVYKAALNFDETRTKIESLVEFVKAEQIEWDKVKDADSRRNHIETLQNTMSALESDKFARTFVKCTYLIRTKRTRSLPQQYVSCLTIIQEASGKGRQTYSKEPFQLYTWILKALICNLADNTEAGNNLPFQDHIDRARSFFLPSSRTDDPALVNTLACGRHLTFLTRILLRKQKEGSDKFISDEVIELAKSIPPYGSSGIFGLNFFQETGACLGSGRDFHKINFSRQKDKLGGLSQKGKAAFNSANAVYDEFITSSVNPVALK